MFLDSTIVNVALPTIAADLPATQVGTLEGQAYVTSGYLATLSAFLILAGALADRYGRRRIFIIGLASFGLASALCGLAPTMEWLIVFRLFQGAAGALLVPGPLSLITANFQGEARAHAFGLWSAATAALTIMGPLVGGVIVDSFSWRIAFLVNVPLVLLALYAAFRHVPESRNEDAPRRLDWLGSIVVAIAVGGITFGLIRGQEQRWSDPAAFVALGIGIAAAIAFPILMVRRRDPLVPPALFRIRAFAVINASTFLIYGALYTYSFLMSVFLQGVLGYSALAAAAVSLPTGILLTLFSTRVGTVAGRIGAWRFLVVGPLFMSAGLAWISRIASDSTPWLLDLGSGIVMPPSDTLVDVLPAVILFGIGITLVVAPLTTTLMGSVPVANAGLGLGHQQCRVTRRLPTPAGDAVHRHHGRVLRLPGQAGALDGHRVECGACRGPAAQSAACGHRSADSERHRPGIDRRVPDRDAGRRGAAPRGRGGQRLRLAAAARAAIRRRLPSPAVWADGPLTGIRTSRHPGSQRQCRRGRWPRHVPRSPGQGHRRTGVGSTRGPPASRSRRWHLPPDADRLARRRGP